MSKENNTVLTDITAKHVQFCYGLKSLVDGGCSTEAISDVLEELCDQIENIQSKIILNN